MRKLLLLVLVLFSPLAAFSAGIPYSPELDARLSPLPYVAKVVYDVSTTSALGSSTVNSGAHGLGVYLPGKAVILRDWMQIVTPFTDDGSGTVAFSCEDANNILTAEDLTNDSAGYKAGNGAVAGIANRCEITATVATASQTAGKLVLYLEYFIGE